LHSLFPSYDTEYIPSIIPSSSGETIAQLHDRCAYALQYIITQADAEDYAHRTQTQERGPGEGDSLGDRTAILICTHAASLIAVGRALTGKMPGDMCEEDFKTYTCGISKFTRRVMPSSVQRLEGRISGEEIPRFNWQHGIGVAGEIDCESNSDCSHLDGGEERGWWVISICLSLFGDLIFR
jgi:transcription factor C subunit 7